MNRIALVAVLSLLFSGVPCLHHADAIEQPDAAGHIPSETAMYGGAHACDPVSAPQADGVIIAFHPTPDHSVCCINAGQTGSETNYPTIRDGASPANAAFTESVRAVRTERTVGIDRPPDIQSPYHQRTTCQRE